MIVSTGGATLEDVDRAMEAIAPHNDQVCLLQCTAAYPAAVEELNLSVITTLRERYPDVVVGLSDHQDGIAMATVAPPAIPQRAESDASTTVTIAALLSCSNSRVIIGLKFVSDDCDQSIDDMRSPGSQSRMPTKLNPAPLNTLA